MTGPPRLLVLRALGLGDLLTAVPALRGLRRAFSSYEIVLAAPPELAAPAALTGAVDRLLPASAPGRAVPSTLRWRGAPPAIAVNLHGSGPPSHRLLAGLAPARILAFAHPAVPEIEGPPWRADEHERDRWCRLLRAYGIPANPSALHLPRPSGPSPAPGAIVVHPGAGSPSRRWPVERYAAVITALRRQGARIAVTAGPGEDALLARVGTAARLPGTDLYADLSFERLSALVADAGAVVSGDTAIAHLAVAHGTPSVTLFGPVSPRLWGPPPLPRHRALWHPGPPGDPHGDRPDPLLLRIGTDEVLAALAELEGLRMLEKGGKR
ncbi:glycosyltransferase family 9 protein [Streptomyces gobiensis]|uniref:glycosyltransferase family 9 protein n=1 Tax=Streptomyces gobiensis TaxID=2875706 RepID=UPI001E620D3C|nr:glycosyltransferase family 9 protein [Streptomyces gobiensis]UGY91599.1 glycosyltransferase family 9 protein [Streptomyces gobiensis]